MFTSGIDRAIDSGLDRDSTFYFQGVIDAAVNGGIAKYQEAFFSPNFLNEFPSHLLHVAKLQALMMDQVRSFGNIASTNNFSSLLGWDKL